MSIAVKLGLVVAGTAGTFSLLQLQDIGVGGVELPALTSLTGLVNVGAVGVSATGAPIDKTYTVRRIRMDDIVARVELITVPGPGPVRLQAQGKPETMKELQVRTNGDELYLRLSRKSDEAWFPWNLFNWWSRDRKAQDLSIRVTAPSGTPYELDGMIGSIAAGDLDAPLRLEAHAVKARFGRLQSAQVSIAGSGDIAVGAVKENLEVESAGSTRFSAASAAAAQVEMAGGGNVQIGPLTGGLDVEVAGSGNVRVAAVNGPVEIEIAGSGNVLIDSGRANPFSVEIAGSGDVVLRGEAVNPRVEIAGSGNVKVNSYTGNLDKDIVGSGDFDVMNPGPPQAGAVPPPAPPPPPGQPPAPPPPPG